MFELATVIKLIPNAISVLTNGGKYEQKALLFLELLKNDNKKLIAYAQKSLELAEKMKDKGTVDEFYSATRGYYFLDEFIVYHRYAAPDDIPKSDRVAKMTQLWLNNIKDLLGTKISDVADKINSQNWDGNELSIIEKVMKEYLELNIKIRKVISNSRKRIRMDRNEKSN